MIINGIKIMTLMAAVSEYGNAMKSLDINPHIIGVGPIESTLNATYLISKAIAENSKPDIIINVGSAGSSTLTQGNLYQIKSVSYRDMDASPFGFAKGETPFVDYPSIFEMPTLFDHYPTATLSTGANIIDKNGSTGTKFDDLQEDCVDMETYAVKRVGDFFNIPVIGLRGISDGKEQVEGIESWEKYLSVIDVEIADYYKKLYENSAALVTLSSQAAQG